MSGRARWSGRARTAWELLQATAFLALASCLVRSVAAIHMLRRRGVEGTLYLGVKRRGPAGLRAHAWVRCGPQFVVGGGMRDEFVVVDSFTRAAS